ncbi:MAG: DUF3330 domain-containing protein [Rhodocyclaceae bacterium]|nr:MAG: DUF3330 domain-containing protein [Rhodocyclaceae bacterium]
MCKGVIIMDALLNTVACHVCLTEVPQSEAQSVEATDYIAHFCGLECYQQWRNAEVDDSASVGPSAAAVQATLQVRAA